MDDREREFFYSAPKEEADEEEYELDLPDPSVVSAEERHAKEVAESVRASIDIDEIYREAERERGAEILEEWIRNFRFRFRFQVKHLLIATAVLAIILTLAKLGLLGSLLVLLIIGSIIGLYLFLKWEERKQQAEAARKREELYARRRANLTATIASRTSGALGGSTISTPAPLTAIPNEADEIWQEAAKPEPFRFHFSMRELVIAMTVACILFGIIRILGSAATATILGFIAVAGLIIHALGFETPQSIVLGWWFILMLYVVLSILGAVS